MAFQMQNEKTICDCDIYTDLEYLIEQVDSQFKNETWPEGDLSKFECYLNNRSRLNLFEVVNMKKMPKSQFCKLTTTTSTKMSSRMMESLTTAKTLMKKTTTNSKVSNIMSTATTAKARG